MDNVNIQNKANFIQLRQLNKVYQTRAGGVPALRDLSTSFSRGSFTGIIGKSGAGKSTLVNMLTGVDSITSGELWVEDIPLHELSQEKASHWRGENVGVVYQSFELLNQLSVLDNVMLPMDLNGSYNRLLSPQKAQLLLDMLEIPDQGSKSPSKLSGGQRQRVAIARSLANDPQIIVADEPTGSLDSETGETVMRIFRTLADEGTTIVMVTHNKDLIPHFDKVLDLEDGRIVSETLMKKTVSKKESLHA